MDHDRVPGFVDAAEIFGRKAQYAAGEDGEE